MFNRNERMILMKKYGKDEALDLYNRYKQIISSALLRDYKQSLKHYLSDESFPLDDAIAFLDYCYTFKKSNYDVIADWLYTLRAIQMQLEK
ncbi:hypothetical protein [Macrococcus brunensis]|nr:hypothetical protein [Macrococcus brunensis]ULG71727.1 hypothetical protein MGG12_10605 [Macrococcus brunensis]